MERSELYSGIYAENIKNQLKNSPLTYYQLQQNNLHLGKFELISILRELEKSNIIEKISDTDNRTGIKISTYNFKKTC